PAGPTAAGRSGHFGATARGASYTSSEPSGFIRASVPVCTNAVGKTFGPKRVERRTQERGGPRGGRPFFARRRFGRGDGAMRAARNWQRPCEKTTLPLGGSRL